MSAAVESMAYVGDVPWHGLGTKVDEDISLREFQRQAGLDWMVQKTPVQFHPHGPEVKDFLRLHWLVCPEPNYGQQAVRRRVKPIQASATGGNL